MGGLLSVEGHAQLREREIFFTMIMTTVNMEQVQVTVHFYFQETSDIQF